METAVCLLIFTEFSSAFMYDSQSHLVHIFNEIRGVIKCFLSKWKLDLVPVWRVSDISVLQKLFSVLVSVYAYIQSSANPLICPWWVKNQGLWVKIFLLHLYSHLFYSTNTKQQNCNWRGYEGLLIWHWHICTLGRRSKIREKYYLWMIHCFVSCRLFQHL